MTDPDLVAKNLAFIQPYVRDVVENRLDELLEFAAVVRRRL